MKMDSLSCCMLGHRAALNRPGPAPEQTVELNPALGFQEGSGLTRSDQLMMKLEYRERRKREDGKRGVEQRKRRVR